MRTQWAGSWAPSKPPLFNARSQRRIVFAVVLVTMAAALLAPTPSTAAFDDLPYFWSDKPAVTTNGPINAMVRHQGTGRIILGGRFTEVCEPTGKCQQVSNLAVLESPATIAPEPPIKLKGEVRALAITGPENWSQNARGPRPLVWIGGAFDSALDAKDEDTRRRRQGLAAFELMRSKVAKHNPFERAQPPMVPGQPRAEVFALAAGPQTAVDRGMRQELYIGGSFRVPTPQCGHPGWGQDNLASVTLRSGPGETVLAEYNDRFASRAADVRWLAPVLAGPWTGVFVNSGAVYSASEGGYIYPTPSLLTGSTGVPTEWNERLDPLPPARRPKIQDMQVDQVLASTTGRLSLHLSGVFNSPGANQAQRQLSFARLDENGQPDNNFYAIAGTERAPMALAGQVTVGSARQARWVVRATNSGTQLTIVDAVTGQPASTINVPLPGGNAPTPGTDPIRSILAVPGWGIMVAGLAQVPNHPSTGNVRFFGWPPGRITRRTVRKRTARNSRQTTVQPRQSGTSPRRPMWIDSPLITDVVEYPGGVAIGGLIQKICDPRRAGDRSPRNCQPVGDGHIIGLSLDGSRVQWMADVKRPRFKIKTPDGKSTFAPPPVMALEWNADTETLWVGGFFQRIEYRARHNLAELEIPHGGRRGLRPRATPMNWLGLRGGRNTQLPSRLGPLPEVEGVFDIEYDDITGGIMVGGNFELGSPNGTNGLNGSPCLKSARRILRLQSASHLDPGFRLHIGNREEASSVSAIASFTVRRRPVPVTGYVIGGAFDSFEWNVQPQPDGGQAGGLLVVDTDGRRVSQRPQHTGVELGNVRQIDEVRDADTNGSTRAVRAIGDFKDEFAIPFGVKGNILDGRRIDQSKAPKPERPAGLDFLTGPLTKLPVKATAIEGGPAQSVYIATRGSDGRPWIGRYSENGELLETVAKGDEGTISRLLLSSDGKYLYATGDFTGLWVSDTDTVHASFAVIPLNR
jgi:hypothetical protein